MDVRQVGSPRDKVPDLLTRPPSGTREFVMDWSHLLVDPVRQLEALAGLHALGFLSRGRVRPVQGSRQRVVRRGPYRAVLPAVGWCWPAQYGDNVLVKRVYPDQGLDMTEIDEMWNEGRFRPHPRGSGWIGFAGTVLVISGVFKIMDAFWAFKYDDEISEQVQTIIFERDPNSWGWVWLVLGVLLIAAGLNVMGGSQWARWFGIVAAGLAALANYQWIFVQPIWTLFVEALLLAVICSLVIYGGPPNSQSNNA